MSSQNKLGLSRTMPANVQREVRQRSRFGCVMCRQALYTYEHFDPPFAEAREHDPKGICLLCPTCQALTTKGRLPKSVIADAYSRIQQEPSPRPPRDTEFFSPYAQNVTIALGSCDFQFVSTIIEIDGRNVLSFSPSDGDPPYVVTGAFNDEKGDPLFQIVNNAWIGPTDVFDVEQVATRLTIRRAAGHVLFSAEKDSTSNAVRIRQLDMVVPPFHILLTDRMLAVGQENAVEGHTHYFILRDWQLRGGSCALALDSSVALVPTATGVRAEGGKGVRLEGTGITVGAGAEQMLVVSMSVFEETGELGATLSESFRNRVMANPDLFASAR